MSRVSRAWFAHLQSHLHPRLNQEVCKCISSKYIFLVTEVILVHLPYLRNAHSWIIFADPQSIFNCKRSHRYSRKSALLIILVIGLLALAKQLAKTLHLILCRVFCVQVLYRLAPAFFLIEMLNLASATLIISSYASRANSAIRSFASSSAIRAWASCSITGVVLLSV